MKNPMDYLATALLVTLVLFLAYLLYRRLLNVLGKEDTPVGYARFLKDMHSIDGDHVMVGLSLPEQMQITLIILNESGKEVKSWENNDMPEGEGYFKWELTGGESGRYTCICTTANQVLERYIHFD